MIAKMQLRARRCAQSSPWASLEPELGSRLASHSAGSGNGSLSERLKSTPEMAICGQSFRLPNIRSTRLRWMENL